MMNDSNRTEAVVDRFVVACQADDRILAAFLGGSHAKGEADEYSDLDLYLITTDDDFNDFCDRREAFVQLLGEPVFIEDFDNPNHVFFILADGTEGEVGFGRQSQFEHFHTGAYTTLLDKMGILAGAVFVAPERDPVEQAENLRRLIYWFWHDLSHFITAMGRGQLWWAQGQLEVLRRSCVNLARLRNNFSDVDAGEEAYFKLEKAVPVEQISALQAAFCAMDPDAMLRSGFLILRFYQELAIPLAEAHGIVYPQSLERIMVRRLENLRR